MRDRVRPPKDLESILDLLKEKKVFGTKQKGMMFAAAIGYATDRYEKPDAYGEGIKLEYFERGADEGFIDALAVAHIDSLDILADDHREERLNIFESYAAGGLAEISRLLELEKSRSELDIIIDALDCLRSARGDRMAQLQGLI